MLKIKNPVKYYLYTKKVEFDPTNIIRGGSPWEKGGRTFSRAAYRDSEFHLCGEILNYNIGLRIALKWKK